MGTLLESLSTGLFGMSVVFAVLVLLIILINLQTRLVGAMTGKGKAAQGQAVPAVSRPAAVPQERAAQSAAPVYPTDLQLVHVDEKTAAIIMAIVCDETGCAPEELYFKSIRLLEE